LQKRSTSEIPRQKRTTQARNDPWPQKESDDGKNNQIVAMFTQNIDSATFF
jgi:hypothetical protein